MCRLRLTFLACLAGAACALQAGAALAAGRVSVSVGRVEFAGLTIEDADIQWTPAEGAGGRIAARASRIRGIDSTGPLAGFQFDCPAIVVAEDTISCLRGRLRGKFGSLGGQDTAFRARRTPDGVLALHFEALALAGGRAEADLRIEEARWRLDADLKDSDIAALAVIAKPWLELPAGFTVAGQASGNVHATGRADAVATADADIAIARLDFADAEGTLAGEAVTGAFRANLRADRGGYLVDDGALDLAGGQAYSDPVFLDFGVHPANLRFAGRLESATARFSAREFALVHRDVLEMQGTAALDLKGDTLLTDAKVRIAGLNLEHALPAYVQPFLIDTAFKDLEGVGRAEGEITIAGGVPTRASLALKDIALDSPSGAISVAGLRGQLNWFDDATRTALAGTIDDALFESRLSWDAAQLWGIEFGKVELPFATTGGHFRLLEPKLLPIFDGGLAIGTLRVRHAGTEQMYVRFDAEIRPISVAPLARAFGWPEFQGTIAGTIPDLQFAQGVVTTGGNLEATVFDGRVVVRDLELRDALGKYPRLHASIDAQNLDLKLLTNTFSFGMITGRLSGRMQDLETFNWMPVSFDARFETPPGDRSKHRISQRAVTNLSSIGGGSGGGVAAALQGGLLRFFDDFGYDRLGLSCRLANDVCVMGGVEPARGGYYIVKGAGLPRIDVIGSQTRVAWTRLVRQLGSIMESEIVVQ